MRWIVCDFIKKNWSEGLFGWCRKKVSQINHSKSLITHRYAEFRSEFVISEIEDDRMFFVMLFFIWLKSTDDLHVLVINFDNHWVLIKHYVLLQIVRIINLLHSVVMHEEVLHFIFQKVYLKLCIMLSLVWKIDYLS